MPSRHPTPKSLFRWWSVSSGEPCYGQRIRIIQCHQPGALKRWPPTAPIAALLSSHPSLHRLPPGQPPRSNPKSPMVTTTSIPSTNLLQTLSGILRTHPRVPWNPRIRRPEALPHEPSHPPRLSKIWPLPTRRIYNASNASLLGTPVRSLRPSIGPVRRLRPTGSPHPRRPLPQLPQRQSRSGRTLPRRPSGHAPRRHIRSRPRPRRQRPLPPPPAHQRNQRRSHASRRRTPARRRHRHHPEMDRRRRPRQHHSRPDPSLLTRPQAAH